MNEKVEKCFTILFNPILMIALFTPKTYRIVREKAINSKYI